MIIGSWEYIKIAGFPGVVRSTEKSALFTNPEKVHLESYFRLFSERKMKT